MKVMYRRTRLCFELLNNWVRSREAEVAQKIIETSLNQKFQEQSENSSTVDEDTTFTEEEALQIRNRRDKRRGVFFSETAETITAPFKPTAFSQTILRGQEARNRLFERLDFSQANVSHFSLPPYCPTGRTKVGVLVCKAALTDEQKRELVKFGLLGDSNGYPTGQIAIKTIDADLTPEFRNNEFPFCVQRLLDVKHPNLVGYLNVSVENNGKKITLLSPNFNCRSLDVWLKKFERSFPDVTMAKFAMSVGAQVLFGLCYLHLVCKTAHGDIKPTNILLDSEGRVAINDYNLVREVVGTQSPTEAQWADLIRDDIRSVARIMYCIAANRPWKTTVNLDPLEVSGLPNEGLRTLIVRMLTGAIPSEMSASYLFDSCFINVSCPTELPAVTIPPEVSPDSYLAYLLRELLNNDSRGPDNKLLFGATSFIKTTLVPRLKFNEPVVSTEWVVQTNITANVYIVRFGGSILQRFRLGNSLKGSLGVIKEIMLPDDQVSSHALRRSVTILERSFHPNIVRQIAATRQGHLVRIITPLVELGSLKRLMMNNSIPRDSIVDFLMAVTYQVLNALLFLDIKLCVRHQDLNANHILIGSDGCVQLCGFGASGRVPIHSLSDMQLLSAVLLRYAPKDGDDTKVLHDFASFLASSSAHVALEHDAMRKYNHELQVSPALIKYGISGTNLVDIYKSWRKFDLSNPYDDGRHIVRSEMIRLLLQMEDGAIAAVKRAVQHAKNLLGEETVVIEENRMAPQP